MACWVEEQRSQGYVRDACLCRIRHKRVYAASMIIPRHCRNPVLQLTFCPLRRGIIRSHSKGPKINQKPSNEVFQSLRGYTWRLFTTLWVANAPRIMPCIRSFAHGSSHWNLLTFGNRSPSDQHNRHYPQQWSFEIHSKVLYRNVVLKLCKPQAISIT